MSNTQKEACVSGFIGSFASLMSLWQPPQWACFGIEVSAVSWQLDGNSFKERNASWIDKLPPWVSKFRMIGTNACSWKQKGCCESSPSCGSTNLCYPVFIHIKPPGVCQLHCVPSRCTVCRTRGSDVKRLRRLAAAQI